MAISTSAPRSSFLSCSSNETPPISSARLSLWLLPYLIEILLDLGGELARRLQNQRARHAGAGAALFQQGQHRQHEGGGLAGAGLGDAQHVRAASTWGMAWPGSASAWCSRHRRLRKKLFRTSRDAKTT